MADSRKIKLCYNDAGHPENVSRRARTLALPAPPARPSACFVPVCCESGACDRPVRENFIPEEIAAVYYAAAQAPALSAVGFDLQLLPDETSGGVFPASRASDRYRRFRSAAVCNAEWSGWIELFDGRSADELWLDAGAAGRRDDFLFFLQASAEAVVTMPDSSATFAGGPLRLTTRFNPALTGQITITRNVAGGSKTRSGALIVLKIRTALAA
ncbi:MAG: hypothetical protein AB7F40_09320 [Victivallaceae bacterium]|nr:hypothetical protein [Victivallaceae bacterium]